MHIVPKTYTAISPSNEETFLPRWSGNSEADASELPDHLRRNVSSVLEYSDVISRFKPLTTHACVTRRRSV